MAHSRSALKRIRQAKANAERNRSRRSRMRTFVKRVEEAVGSGDMDLANQALRRAQAELDRGVAKGVLKRNAASRKISRLNRRVKALA